MTVCKRQLNDPGRMCILHIVFDSDIEIIDSMHLADYALVARIDTQHARRALQDSLMDAAVMQPACFVRLASEWLWRLIHNHGALS